MPLLVRYCLNALWGPFFISTSVILFILNLLFYILEFLKYLFEFQAGVLNSLRLLLYIQPSFLILALPLGFLAAILMVYGRLSEDRETMAIESCGFPLSIVVWPMIGFSVLLSLFLVFFMDRVLPWGNISFLKLQTKIISERTAIVVRERIFIKDFEGYVLYAAEKDDKRDLLKGVTVEFLDARKYPYRLIVAKEGSLHQDKKNFHAILDLQDGIMQQLGTEKKKDLDEFFQMQFSTCSLDLSANKMPGGPIDFRDSRNISIRELAARIKEDKEKKQDARRDETEFHKKFSIPFSALAFALIGIPLGLLSKSGSFSGAFFTVVLAAVYWILITYGDVGGPMGAVSPFLAMWIPNFALMAVGLVLVYWLHHRYDFWRNLFQKKSKGDSPRGRDPGSFKFMDRP